MSTNVQELDIQIKAEANKASRALDTLSTKLGDIGTKLSNLGNTGFKQFASDINTFSTAVKGLKGLKIDIPKVDSRSVASLTKNLATLQTVDANQISSISTSMRNLSVTMQMLSTINVDTRRLRAVANSLTVLGQSNLGNFDTSSIGRVSQALNSFQNVPDISQTFARFINGLASLANAGTKANETANALPDLSNKLNDVIRKMSSLPSVSDDVNNFVSSLAKLANAGNRTLNTSQNLGALSTAVNNFMASLQNAPKINESTLRAVEALSRLASAGNRVNASSSQVSHAFNTMSSTGQKAGNVLKGVGNKITSAFKQIGDSRHHLNNASSSLRTLLTAGLAYKALYGLKEFATTSVSLGSSITELENVVDTAFGSMSTKAYEFAKTAQTQFGLSENAAMQYSGTLMAMLKSTGMSIDKASTMSLKLSGLAGDMASFYNISSDDAFRALRSAISGEIEPLRRYGINLSVANIEAYALANGITKSYQAMTEAEKATLRYNYILANTKDQQGDFAKTANTFANQVRVLSLSFQQLKSVLGQGFIVALTPIVQGLNFLIAKLTQAAKVFRSFMYVLSGKTFKTNRGIVDDMATIGNSADDVAGIGSAGDSASDGLDNATDSAKKLKKALSVLPFDQLNQLTDNTKNSSTGTDSLGGLGGIGDLDNPLEGMAEDMADEFERQESYLNEWARRIREAFLANDWVKLGEVIADGLNKGLQKLYDVLNWKNVGPRIKAFTNAFTTTINSLVDHLNWNLMGRSIGAGINTLVNSLNLLLEGIDWKNLGRKFADGLNGVFSEINWRNLGHAIGNWFMVAWNTFYGFVEKLDFGLIGRSIAEGLNGIVDKISLSDIGTALGNMLNGAFNTLSNFASTFSWGNLVNNIANGISSFISTFEWTKNGESLNKFIQKLLDALVDLTEKLPVEEFATKLGEMLDKIEWGKVISKLITSISNVLFPAIDGLWDSATGKFLLGIGAFKLALGGISLVKSVSGVVNVVKSLASGVFNLGSESSVAAPLISKLAGPIKTLASRLWGAFNYTTLAGGGLQALGRILGGVTSVVYAFALSMKATEVSVGGTESVLEEGVVYAESFGKALESLGQKGIITAEQQEELANKLSNITVNSKNSVEFLSQLQTALEETGVSSSELATVADELGLDLSELVVMLRNGENATKLMAEEMAKAAEKGNALTFDDLTEKINSLNETQEKVDFSKMVISATNAIDEMGGIWEDGKQILGEKAVQIYAEILKGLQPDENGFYTLANGQMVQFGNGLKDKQEDVRATLDETLRTAIDTALPDGYDLIYKMGVAMILGIPDAVSDEEKTVEDSWKELLPKDKLKTDAKKSGEEIGKNVNEGLKTGIENNKSGVETATSNLATKSLLDILKKDLDIHSPSGEAESCGMYFDQGLAKGISNHSGVVEGSIKTLGDSLKTSMDGYMASITSGVDAVVTSISGKLSGIGTMASGLRETILNAFRNIHVPLPHISINWDRKITVGNRWFTIPSFGINWYAKGGLFSNASVIGVGEAGQEAVLPLENRRTMSRIADSITSNMSAGMGAMDTEKLVQAVERGVVQAFMNNSSQQQPIIVNAELRTENNEVLARAVSRGQRSINYRTGASVVY